MSYSGPPPPYSETAPKSNSGIMPGHVVQTPFGPTQPHIDQMKPASGEFMGAIHNPYGVSKQQHPPQTNAPYPTDAKQPYSPPSQMESGPYPGGTIGGSYTSNIGGGASYQSPPRSSIGGGSSYQTPASIGSGSSSYSPLPNPNIGSGAPQNYQGMPQPRLPQQGPIGTGTGPGIYPSMGQAPYPSSTYNSGMGPSGPPQSFMPALPRPGPPMFNNDPSAPLAGRMGQMNISGPPGNYPPPRPYATYQNSPSPIMGSGASPIMGNGASYRDGSSYQNPISMGSGRYSPRGSYSPPREGYSGSRGYSSGTATPYNTPIISNFPSPRSGVMMGAPVIGYGSSGCTSVPSSHGYCSPSYPSCHKKPHHSHHHHHHC